MHPSFQRYGFGVRPLPKSWLCSWLSDMEQGPHPFYNSVSSSVKWIWRPSASQAYHAVFLLLHYSSDMQALSVF